MKTIFNLRTLVMLSLLILSPVFILAQQAQADKKAADLKKLETGVATAQAKVALNERKLTVADSLDNAGTNLIAESKSETKVIAGERKKLDKDYATQLKSLTKLSTSKDKEVATKAKADLKTLNAQYKADSKASDTRLSAATKKSTTGESNITKGKTIKTNARDALKVSKASLDAAQKRYDIASGKDEKATPKGKKK
jgi:hypothetical protein